MKKIIVSIVALLFATIGVAKEVTLLMDWFPQGNQSGFWQAQLDNDNHDLKINIKPGGPKVNTRTAVASGQVEFGLGGSDSVMMANSKGAKIKAVFINLDHVPYTLVYHPNTGVNSIQDLNGRRFAVVMGITYWKWVKHTYKLDKVKDFPLTGFNEVRYSEKEKKVVYEPVKLEQNYRNFDFESPWEGTRYIKEIKKEEKDDKKN
jgi:ABC-type nitrate/sulfonate/bicarbonate transport system substrate-binding protein